jgi:hypothetical protein
MSSLLALLALSFPAPTVAAVEPAPAPLEPALAPLAPLADDMPEMEYTYIEANYLWTDSDAADESVGGAEFIGSLELPLNFFLQGAYTIQEDNVDVETYRLGAGWHFGLIPRLDVYGLVSYVHAELDGSASDFSSDGVAADLGARFLLTDSLEINGAIKWVDVENEQTGISLGARFYITDSISLGGRVDVLEDDESYGAGLRLEL